MRRMKRTAGLNLSSSIWSLAAPALLILVTRAAAIDFTRSEDSLGNLDIYEVYIRYTTSSKTIIFQHIGIFSQRGHHDQQINYDKLFKINDHETCMIYDA